LARICVTHAGINASGASQQPCGRALACGTFCYRGEWPLASSAGSLAPLDCRAASERGWCKANACDGEVFRFLYRLAAFKPTSLRTNPFAAPFHLRAIGRLIRRSGLLPSRRGTLARSRLAKRSNCVFGGSWGLPLRGGRDPSYPAIARARYTKIYFAENQLSPSLIGLAPLTTGRPRALQRSRVRPLGGWPAACPWLGHLASGLMLLTSVRPTCASSY
jgi:hypothetical protein